MVYSLTMRRSWSFLIFFLGLVLLLFCFSRPAYRWAKRERARWLEQKAVALKKEGRSLDALQTLSAAEALAPDDPVVLRASAEIYGEFGLDRALDYWKALSILPGFEEEGLKGGIRFALGTGHLVEAKDLLNTLLSGDSASIENLNLSAQFQLATGNRDEAKRILEASFQSHPDSAEARFDLGKILFFSSQPTEVERGKKLLLSLQENRERIGLEALRLLANSHSSLNPELKKKTGHLLRSHPLATEIDHWTGEMEEAASPNAKAWFEELVGRYRNGDAQKKLALARWLNLQSQPDEVLQLVSEDEARKRSDLFLVYADALARLFRWKVLAQVFARPVPLDEVLVELYRARIAHELGSTEDEKIHWDRVFLASASKPQTLWYVERYAEELGNYTKAVEAYRRLSEYPPTAQRAFANWIRLTERIGSTRDLRDVVRLVSRAYPGDLSARNDYAYLNLLLGEEVEESRAIAADLYGQNPRRLAYRASLALAYLKERQEAQALQLFQNVSIDWAQAYPGWQAVYVAVLGENKNVQEARKQAAQISLGKLKPEERLLIQPWL